MKTTNLCNVFRSVSVTFVGNWLRLLKVAVTSSNMYARRHDTAPPNGLTGQNQMLFSTTRANPMEQSPNQLPQTLPILTYTRQREIEILSDVIYIHQPMLPAKCYCFAVANAPVTPNARCHCGACTT